MTKHYAGESITLGGQLTEPDGRPLTPQPVDGVDISVLSDDETTTHLAAAAAARVKEESGTSTGANTTTTLADTGKNWKPDQWKGYLVRIVSGLGLAQERRVKSNTATVLTIEGDPKKGVSHLWTTTPDNTSGYELHLAAYERLWNSTTDLKGKTVTLVVVAKDAVLYPNGSKEKLKLYLE